MEPTNSDELYDNITNNIDGECSQPLLAESATIVESTPRINRYSSREKCLNLIAYWLLGLTNNFGYVIMLSAAHDLLSPKKSTIQSELIAEFKGTNPRDCNEVSTGAVLIADILPSLFMKIISPFMFSHVHIRILMVFGLTVMAFTFVGIATSTGLALAGVVCASAAAGLGEATFLAYTAYFHRNVISTWSSGTGAAGVFGSLSYAGLTSVGLSPNNTVFSMLFIPAVMALSFWLILDHPQNTRVCCAQDNRNENELIPSTSPGNHTLFTFQQKWQMIPYLAKYMLPLFFVYIAEYLINQGMLELIYYPQLGWLNHSEQYRWFQVIYQIGVLISRSSVNIIHIEKVWIMSLLQWLNVGIILIFAVYMKLGSIWIVFFLILWEGLLGGAAYVNSFYKIATEVESHKQYFAMQVTSLSDTAGVALAGFFAIPLHNYICELPTPNFL